MPPAISEDKIAEIRQATDIVAVIGESLPLEKAGQNYLGYCPFHAEKTPSFSVSPGKQFFHCFGCGSGGDVFSFLQKKEGLTFIEAVTLLARRSGLALPAAEVSPAQAQRYSERRLLYQIHQEALTFYQRALQNGPMARTAQDYLARRQTRASIIKEFDLGYAPEGWDHLARFFDKRQISLDLAVKAGLVAPRNQGKGHYDRFRNRIIFPIFDERARVVAFGGRLLQDDHKSPKYLNSPETPIFNKRTVLYGLHRSRGPCQQAGLVYIVEGYFDLLALHQHGICNSVATLGTALSSDHLKRLKIHANRAVLVFDADPAGIKAAERSLRLFSEMAMAVRILCLPEGYDPDSYVFKYGAQAFKNLADQALAPLNFMLENAISRHGADTEGRLRVLAQMLDSLTAISDPLARAMYVREVAERLELSEALLAQKVEQRLAARISGEQQPERRAAHQQAAPSQHAALPPAASCGPDTSRPNQWRLEERIIAMMLHYPDIVPVIRQRHLLDIFEDRTLQAFGRIILEQAAQKQNGAQPEDLAAQVLAKVRDAQHQQTLSALAVQVEVWNHTGCMRLIKQYESCRRRFASSITQQIKAAQAAGDPQLFSLLEDKQQEMQHLRVRANFVNP